MRSKQQSFVTREINQMKQIYVSVNLYEADHDQASPPSLANLTGEYLPAGLLKCPTDVRIPLARNDWPANPWIRLSGFDPEQFRQQRVPYLNSYFYLRTFQGRYPAGRSYDEYRNNPSVGLLSGVGLMECTSSSQPNSIGGCDYPKKDAKVDAGQPPLNLYGTYVTVRTDGSEVIRKRSDQCVGSDMSLNELFLFYTPSCGSAVLPTSD